MKKWMRLAVAAALWQPAGRAVDWKELKQQGCVSDFAAVIDTASRSQLNDYCAAVEQSTGVQMAFVTLSSLQGEPVDDVAGTIFSAWGVGQHSKSGGGILLLLSIREHRSNVAAGPGLGPLLAGGLHDRILREMRPAVRHAEYGQAMMGAAEQIGNTLAEARHVTVAARLSRRFRPSFADWLPWPLVSGAIFFLAGLLLWLMRSSGGLAPGAIPSSTKARATWGGRGSGGFGGPDSGDGFGGFGGGDSGRGRCSGDW
jgi:uncharacterized protein